MRRRQIKGVPFAMSSRKPKTYGANGRYFLDPTGKTLRTAGPEERVRQEFVKFLTDRVGVPLLFLTTEDAVSHYRAGSRGRMDICGLTAERSPDRRDSTAPPPLFVVECKRQGLVLEVEENRRQVHSYVKRVGAKLAILTNGDETHVYIYDGDNDKLRKLELPANTVPTYQEMLSIGDYQIELEVPSVYCRPAWEDLPDSTEGLRGGFASMVGTESETGRIRWLASLGSLLLDEQGFEFGKWRRSGFDVKDMGTALVSPTNRSGGRWTGEYRTFLVTDGGRELRMARFLMAADWKKRTTLAVAVDDESGTTRNELQLDMDFRETVEWSPTTAVIRHNGKLPGGKKGWTKDALIDYAREHAPHLVEDEYIHLGELPVTCYVERPAARKFITNCIEYALLRKRFKET